MSKDIFSSTPSKKYQQDDTTVYGSGDPLWSPCVSPPPVLTVSSFTSKAQCNLDTEGHCITCSDEAIPVQVVSINEQTGMALVAVQGQMEEVDITLIEAVQSGDTLLVHGGVAIGSIEATDHE